jgi:excisionase family DNA binding protein
LTTLHKDNSEIPQLVDIPTMARTLGDNVRHIRRLVAERRIPYIKVGHFVRFDARDIRLWLDEHRQDWRA